MKHILFCSILICLTALPVFSELTDADLDKIRLIVNDSEKRMKEVVKSEITASEKRMKEYISQEIKTVNAKIEGQENRLSQIFWLVIALIGLIAAAIGIPQWHNRKDRTQEKQIEELTQEFETLKQQGAFSKGIET